MPPAASTSASNTITPSACTPSLSGGGVVDYGKISAKDLQQDKSTVLPHRAIQMDIDCEASTLYAFKSIDNRPGTSHYGPGHPSHGLGLINGSQKLGTLDLTRDGAIADGAPITLLASFNGIRWSSVSPMDLMQTDMIQAFGDTSSGTRAPIPIKNLTSQLRIIPIIAPAKNLTLTNEVNIDGSATLEVLYL